MKKLLLIALCFISIGLQAQWKIVHYEGTTNYYTACDVAGITEIFYNSTMAGSEPITVTVSYVDEKFVMEFYNEHGNRLLFKDRKGVLDIVTSEGDEIVLPCSQFEYKSCIFLSGANAEILLRTILNNSFITCFYVADELFRASSNQFTIERGNFKQKYYEAASN